jgi:hypothetical protein
LKEQSKIGINNSVDFYSYAKFHFNLKPFGHPDEDSHTGYAEVLYDLIAKYYLHSED